MNLYILPKRKSKYTLYCDEFESTHEKTDDTSQTQEKNKFLSLIVKGYKTLTSKSRQYEKILKEIRNLDSINVIYPVNLSEDEAKKVYNQIIQSKIKKHKRKP